MIVVHVIVIYVVSCQIIILGLNEHLILMLLYALCYVGPVTQTVYVLRSSEEKSYKVVRLSYDNKLTKFILPTLKYFVIRFMDTSHEIRIIFRNASTADH